jgi:serine/threonine protein kinase
MKTCRVCQRSYSTNFANCPQDGTPLVETEEWAAGTVVRGKYEIIQKIGQGAMGTVYKALHLHFQEVRALKVIAAKLSSDRTFVKRFEQEAILARKLQHPNAVHVDDIDETEDGQPFIVMEFIEGENLRKVISAVGPMPPMRVSLIIRQVAAALDAAHSLGIIHRDIKPENIVLIQSHKKDVAKVLDFGIAKFKELQNGTAAASATDTGMVVGTPPYMSPEQALAAPGNELDGRADIYSLGSVMYQMLTDELPIKGDTPLQIVLAHIQNPPIPIQAARAGVKIPQPLADLVMKCLEKNREDRPPNGRAIIEELEKWEVQEQKKEQGKNEPRLRPMAAARSTAQAADVTSTSNRAAEFEGRRAGQQVSQHFGRSWILRAALLVVAIGIAGAWRYQIALLRMVKPHEESAASSTLPQPRTDASDPEKQADTLPGAGNEKSDAPTAASDNLSARNANSAPATPPDKPLPPPEPSKASNYTDATDAKVSPMAGTSAEHDGFKAVQAEKDEAQQIQRLDEFVAKFPNSELLADSYTLYYRDYRSLKNFPKVIEYADKLVALGNKADANARFQALYARAIAYNTLRPDDLEQARQAKEAVAVTLRTVSEIKKPANVTEAAFAAQLKPVLAYLDETAGTADMKLKAYASAVDDFRAALALNPEDGAATYRVGLAYLGMTPPRQLDGFWAIARATTAKSMSEPQSQEIKEYLRKLIQNYEQTACSSVVDSQLSELIQAAGNSSERPMSYKLPSKSDLDAARKNMTVGTVMTDLKAGGDKAEATWMAACGLEFPNVPSKVIHVAAGDPVVMNVVLVTSEVEFQEARRPNMEVNLAGQPEAVGIRVGSAVHFTGTLTSYERMPLMLHWQKARIKPQDNPAGNR